MDNLEVAALEWADGLMEGNDFPYYYNPKPKKKKIYKCYKCKQEIIFKNNPQKIPFNKDGKRHKCFKNKKKK